MAAHKSAPPRDDPEQSRRFIEVAKEAGATEESETFGDVVDRLGKSPPAARPGKSKRAKKAQSPKKI
jgi:hypothetical protein